MNGLELTEPAMSLRDYFAVQVLPQCLASLHDDWLAGKGAWPTNYETVLAQQAYQLADAMMTARGQGPRTKAHR